LSDQGFRKLLFEDDKTCFSETGDEKSLCDESATCNIAENALFIMVSEDQSSRLFQISDQKQFKNRAKNIFWSKKRFFDR
jgi:hypothetical protein